ncbi:uncharacterized protein NESG_01295 [Nematocida ausubeli]|uniref:Uncharacterized protein n=1 Tax=Nematocida ausubeli (strain ATCC PRA-371 / ERTm2) TaxID=1913371 RepID=A0A086J211_NEMA1|nr:uncharacterized protein NESG_01295 [Nematocida ausubeli]KFG26179.1 hypothetical protein NESG_01295 [Nematocida ausubeli]
MNIYIHRSRQKMAEKEDLVRKRIYDQIMPEILAPAQYIEDTQILYYYILMNLNLKEILPGVDEKLLSIIQGHLYTESIDRAYLTHLYRTDRNTVNTARSILDGITMYINEALALYTPEEKKDASVTESSSKSSKVNTGAEFVVASKNMLFDNYDVLYHMALSTYAHNIVYTLVNHAYNVVKQRYRCADTPIMPFPELYNEMEGVGVHSYMINEINTLYKLMACHAGEDDLNTVLCNIRSAHHHYARIARINGAEQRVGWCNAVVEMYIKHAINYIGNIQTEKPKAKATSQGVELNSTSSKRTEYPRSYDYLYNEFEYDTVLSLISNRMDATADIYDRSKKEEHLLLVLSSLSAHSIMFYYAYYMLFSICIAVGIGASVALLLNSLLICKYTSRSSLLTDGRYTTAALIISILVNAIHLEKHLLNYKKSTLALIEYEYDKIFINMVYIGVISIILFYLNPAILAWPAFKIFICVVGGISFILSLFDSYARKRSILSIFTYRAMTYTLFCSINIAFVVYLVWQFKKTDINMYMA